MMQFEDLGFCKKGEGPDFVRSHTLHQRRHRFPHNTSGGQLSVGQAGAAGGLLGLVEAMRQLIGAAARHAGAAMRADCLVSGFGMINYDRGLSSGAAILARAYSDRTAVRPKRKNPLQRTRQPLSPQGVRSRTAHGLTAAAAEGRFALQVCDDCNDRGLSAARLPVRRACRRGCRSGTSTRRHAGRRNHGADFDRSVFSRAHAVAGRHREARCRAARCRASARRCAARASRVRLDLKLDKSGSAVVMALPEKDTPNMADDPHLREMTCDPKFRRVLITDGRTRSARRWPRPSPRPGRRSSSSASPIPGSRFRA